MADNGLANIGLVDPVDMTLVSNGYGEFPNGYRLTLRGRMGIAKALGFTKFMSSDHCGCPDPKEGDGVHVPGEPTEEICLASPWLAGERDATEVESLRSQLAEARRSGETAVRQEVKKKQQAYDLAAREQVRANRAESDLAAERAKTAAVREVVNFFIYDAGWRNVILAALDTPVVPEPAEVEWEYGWATGSTITPLGDRQQAEQFAAESEGEVEIGRGDRGSRFMRRIRVHQNEWLPVPTSTENEGQN